MPTALSASCTRSPISAGATLRFSGPNATSAATVVVTIWSSGFWNTTPIERRALRYAPASAPCASSNTVWPISLTVPWSGAANPAIRRATGPDAQIHAVEHPGGAVVVAEPHAVEFDWRACGYIVRHRLSRFEIGL